MAIQATCDEVSIPANIRVSKFYLMNSRVILKSSDYFSKASKKKSNISGTSYFLFFLISTLFYINEFVKFSYYEYSSIHSFSFLNKYLSANLVPNKLSFTLYLNVLLF
jgi:hypothetical protein